MKTTFLCAVAVLAAVLLVSATVWEGVTDVAYAKDLPRAYSIATNSFPRNTVVDVTNLENGKMVRVIVISGLETTGLLATLSQNAANALDVRHDSTCRIRMTQTSVNASQYARAGAPPPVLQLGPIDASGVASAAESEPPASRPAAAESTPVTESVTTTTRTTTTESAPAANRTPAAENAPVAAASRSVATESAPAASKPAATSNAPAANRTPATENAPAANRTTTTETVTTTTRTTTTESAPVANNATPPNKPAAVSIIAADELPAIDDVDAATVDEPAATDDVIAVNEPAADEPAMTNNAIAVSEPTVTDNTIAVNEPAVTDNVTAADEPEVTNNVIAANEPAMTDNVIAADEPAMTDNAVAAAGPARTVTENQSEPRMASGTFTLIPADERLPPAHEQPSVAPSTAAPRNTAPNGAASATAAPRNVAPNSIAPVAAAPREAAPPRTAAPPAAYAPPAEFSPFQAPLINSLEQGKWYVQLGVYSRPDNVEDEISRIGPAYPVAIQNIGSDTSPMFRVLLGPLNQGESGAMLQRFKSIGYADAFVRHN